MAIKIKPIADIASKWAEVTPGRAAYYEAGASVAGADWEKGATAAAPAYKAAISAVNIEKMFTGGIKRAGAAKYERKVKDVGIGRFGPGITAAVPDFTAGFDPFVSTIAALTLPARQPRGADANLERVRVIAKELNKKRLALRAAGA
jgi:hypothetical protein